MHAAAILPLLTQLSSDPLLIRSDCSHLPALLARRVLDTRRADVSSDKPREPYPWEQREAVRILPGGVAIVPCRGMLCAGLDQETAWYWDICRPEAIQAAVTALAARTDVQVVLFDVNSPGGYTTAIPETAELVSRLGQSKLTLAFTSGMMCSAAYWIGSQCSRIIATPSATVGSVGTYAVVYDFSKMFEAEGIVTHVARAGRLKGIGVPGDPVTPEQLAFLQSGVDRINAAFLAAVRGGRGDLSEDDLQGQWFDGATAVDKRLADATVLTRDELLGALTIAQGV
jgi:ClpP class serine protease